MPDTMKKVLHFLSSKMGPFPSQVMMLLRPEVSPVFEETGGLSGSRDEANTYLSNIWGVTKWWFPLSFLFWGFR